MLVLSRKEGQAIYIGDVRVIIKEVRGKHVSLGIEAPREIPVYREEIYVEKNKERDASAGS